MSEPFSRSAPSAFEVVQLQPNIFHDFDFFASSPASAFLWRDAAATAPATSSGVGGDIYFSLRLVFEPAVEGAMDVATEIEAECNEPFERQRYFINLSLKSRQRGTM